SQRLKFFFVNEILHQVRKKTGESISESKDNIKEKLVSKHQVNKMVLKYFKKNNNLMGINKYKFELFLDFKKMTDNKNYVMLFKSIVKCEFFNLYQKINIFLFLIFHITTGKGITKLKHKFKDGKI